MVNTRLCGVEVMTKADITRKEAWGVDGKGDTTELKTSVWSHQSGWRDAWKLVRRGDREERQGRTLGT